MTDLLLSHGYFLADDVHERKYMKPYPPLGLLYLSAYLKAAGFLVDVLDTTFASFPRAAAALAASDAPVVGLYTNLMTRPAVLRLVAAARGAGKHVVLGGPESAAYPEAYLDRGADVVVFGEGEVTARELLEGLASAGPHRLHAVSGIAFRSEDGQIVRTPPREPIADLDTLPWPDREAIALSDYLGCWREHHGAGSVSVITARGCPYRCRWCSHAVYGHTHRRRSPGDVAREIAHVRARWGPDQLWIADDVFTIHHGWLRRFAEEMGRWGRPLPFETITRADRVNPEVVDLMRQLGCYRVWIGSESGSQRVLDAMERGVTPEQVQDAVRLFQAAGIAVGLFLMWGYEGETAEDIEATIDHVKAADPDVYLTTVAYPIKGTPYFDEVADRISSPVPWAEGSDRLNRVSGRRRRAYYDMATQRLRAAVDAHRARADLPRSTVPWLRARVVAASAGVAMRLAALPSGR